MMTNHSQTSIGRSALRIAAVSGLAGLAALLVSAGTWTEGGPMCLSDGELERVVGDNTDGKCFTTTLCSLGRGNETNCAYCATGASTSICCTSQRIEDTCQYDQPSFCVGQMVKMMTGTTFGEVGTCASCTSAQFTENGLCQGIQSASGNACGP